MQRKWISLGMRVSGNYESIFVTSIELFIVADVVQLWRCDVITIKVAKHGYCFVDNRLITWQSYMVKIS